VADEIYTRSRPLVELLVHFETPTRARRGSRLALFGVFALAEVAVTHSGDAHESLGGQSSTEHAPRAESDPHVGK